MTHILFGTSLSGLVRKIELIVLHLLDELVAESDIDDQTRIATEHGIERRRDLTMVDCTIDFGVPKPASFVGGHFLTDIDGTLERSHTAIEILNGSITVRTESSKVEIDVCEHPIHVLAYIGC